MVRSTVAGGRQDIGPARLEVWAEGHDKHADRLAIAAIEDRQDRLPRFSRQHPPQIV
jgi:hypothetical protein